MSYNVAATGSRYAAYSDATLLKKFGLADKKVTLCESSFELIKTKFSKRLNLFDFSWAFSQKNALIKVSVSHGATKRTCL